jgi:hypothetical protein
MIVAKIFHLAFWTAKLQQVFLQAGTPTGDVGGFPDRFFIFMIGGAVLLWIIAMIIVYYLFSKNSEDKY